MFIAKDTTTIDCSRWNRLKCIKLSNCFLIENRRCFQRWEENMLFFLRSTEFVIEILAEKLNCCKNWTVNYHYRIFRFLKVILICFYSFDFCRNAYFFYFSTDSISANRSRIWKTIIVVKIALGHFLKNAIFFWKCLSSSFNCGKWEIYNHQLTVRNISLFLDAIDSISTYFVAVWDEKCERFICVSLQITIFRVILASRSQ